MQIYNNRQLKTLVEVLEALQYDTLVYHQSIRITSSDTTGNVYVKYTRCHDTNAKRRINRKLTIDLEGQKIREKYLGDEV